MFLIVQWQRETITSHYFNGYRKNRRHFVFCLDPALIFRISLISWKHRIPSSGRIFWWDRSCWSCLSFNGKCLHSRAAPAKNNKSVFRQRKTVRRIFALSTGQEAAWLMWPIAFKQAWEFVFCWTGGMPLWCGQRTPAARNLFILNIGLFSWRYTFHWYAIKIYRSSRTLLPRKKLNSV